LKNVIFITYFEIGTPDRIVGTIINYIQFNIIIITIKYKAIFLLLDCAYHWQSQPSCLGSANSFENINKTPLF